MKTCLKHWKAVLNLSLLRGMVPGWGRWLPRLSSPSPFGRCPRSSSSLCRSGSPPACFPIFPLWLPHGSEGVNRVNFWQWCLRWRCCRVWYIRWVRIPRCWSRFLFWGRAPPHPSCCWLIPWGLWLRWTRSWFRRSLALGFVRYCRTRSYIRIPIYYN